MVRLSLGFAILLVSACAAAATPASSSQPPAEPARRAEIERAVLITIDGLRPVDALRFPTLRGLASEGAFAAPPEGALSVLPSVTYPSHTSMVTGCYPARHGITTNLALDPTPEGKNQGGWRWYADDIRVPTLWDAAFAAGLRTALITWPVTVHARATVRLPEFWRAGTEEDLKLLRALSSDGLLERVERAHPGFLARYLPQHIEDSATIDAALTVLAEDAPALLVTHIWQSDDAQHSYGPDSPEADAALANADAQLARLVEGLRAMPEWPRTVLVVASDHGFVRVHTRVGINVHLARAGLAERLFFSSNGGLVYLYPRSAGDAAARDQALTFFRALAADPAQGIARVLDAGDIAREHGDPLAALALEAIPGFTFGKLEQGGPLVPAGDLRGVHGYAPERPEMRATLILAGPRIPRTTLHGARLVDIAPTLAAWLDVPLPGTDGRPLAITLRRATP